MPLDSQFPRIIQNHRPDTERAGIRREATIARGLVGLLFLALWLGDLAVLAALQVIPAAWPHWFSVLVLGSSMGQVAVLCGGLVWSHGNFVLRLLIGGVWLAGLSQLNAYAELSSPSAVWFGGLLIYSLLILLPCQLVRLLGVELQLWPGDAGPHDLPPSLDRPSASGDGLVGAHRKVAPRTRGRYSMGALFSVTTALAIVLAAAKLAKFPVAQMVSSWKLFLLLAVPSLLVGGSVLLPGFDSPRWKAGIVIVLFMMMIITGALLSDHVPTQGRDNLQVAWLLNGANVGMVAAVAGVLRIAGLRLTRRRGASPASA